MGSEKRLLYERFLWKREELGLQAPARSVFAGAKRRTLNAVSISERSLGILR